MVGVPNVSRITFCGIGEPVPFSFFGIQVSLVVFVAVIVIIESLKEIIEAQDIIW